MPGFDARDFSRELACAPLSAGSEEEMSLWKDLRVLLAEDDRDTKLLIRRQLLALGVEDLVIVGDGEQAVLAVLEQPVFDLVLMDLSMPTMDGLEAARRIRGQGFSPGELPIVALTALDFREESLAAGMNEHLRKPVCLRDLSCVIRGVTPRKAQRQGSCARNAAC